MALTTALVILSGNSHAQGPIIDVSFSDANLEACIIGHAQTNDWVNTEQVTRLVRHKRNIVTLGGIEQFHNLKSLNLIINDIEDISP
jgi:Leucine-rich repeat (LRR) protein